MERGLENTTFSKCKERLVMDHQLGYSCVCHVGNQILVSMPSLYLLQTIRIDLPRFMQSQRHPSILKGGTRD